MHMDLSQPSANQGPPLGWLMAFCISFKQIVGGGVIAMPGIAIGMTGAGILLAYPLASGCMLIASLPLMVLGAVMPVSGSLYAWPARLLGERIGFLALWMHLISHLVISVYAQTAARTLHGIWPGLPELPVAVVLLTFVWLVNLTGTLNSARFGFVLTAITVTALGFYIIAAAPQVDPARLHPLLPKGIDGLLQATSLLCFSAGGASFILELGADVRQAHRTLPQVIVAASVAASLLYLAIAVVTVGAFSSASTAGKPLSLIARYALAPGAFVGFSLATGVVSMLGAISVNLLWGSRGLLMASGDGWLLSRMGERNRRFGTPHWALTCLFGLGLLPVVLELPMEHIVRIGLFGAIAASMVSVLCCITLALRLPARLRAVQGMPAPLAVGLLAVLALAIQSLLLILLARAMDTRDAVLLSLWGIAGLLLSRLKRSQSVVQSLGL